MAGSTELAAALPDYEVTTELGRGAMGIVYLGTHRKLGRTVAIKELPAAFGVDSDVRERFLVEARTVASLNHPHVVVIHDFVDRDGHLAIVMEHLPNGTVWDQFVNQGLAGPRAVGLALATLAGLAHAHERGVMHRDIKPENLIFTHDWQLKVTDFGIAQVLTGTETMSTLEGSIVGTPAYMSPEQAEGRVCGPPADVYASAAMLYEMLSGQLPFDGHDDAMSMALARLSEDPTPLSDVGIAVPPAIAEVTMRGLSRAESDRWPSAEAFGVALGRAAADEWGVDWMSAAGTMVQGSPVIEQAARTTTHPVAPTPAAPTPENYPPSAAAQTIIAPDAPTAPTTGVPGAETARAEPAEPSPAPAPQSRPPARATTPPPTAPVQPRQVARVEGADLNALAPSDIVKLREVRKPSSPLPALLLGLAALAACIWSLTQQGIGLDPSPANAAGVTIAGSPVSDSLPPPPADFTAPIAVSGLPSGPLQASFLGIPLGSGEVSGSTFDPDYLKFTAAGVVELTSGDTSVPVRVSNDPWATAPFVVAVMLALGGLASVSSNMRAMRSRRLRIGAYVGLFISGALAAAAIAVLAMIVLEAATVPPVVPAVLGGLAAVLLGEAYRRIRRRRRLKRIQVARARR